MTTKNNRGTILVAGCRKDVLDLFTRYFTQKGYEISETADIRNALILTPELFPQLILLSAVRKPEDAFSVCTQLTTHKQQELRDIPILLILPEEEQSLVAHAYAAGADDYIVPSVHWQCQAYRMEHLLLRQRRLAELREQITDLQLAEITAEVAVSAKSEFFANISHELKTPLHGILSYVRFGLKRLDKAPRKKLGEYFQEIEDCGKRLLILLNDLLELAKLEAGKVKYTFQPRNIIDEVVTVIDELSHLAEEKGISVHQNIDTQSVPVLFDRRWIGRVLRILVVNAIHFSNAGDTIHVEIKQLPTGKTKGPVVEISIIDQGAGIQGGEPGHLFDPLLHNSLGRGESYGTAMGLSICRQIIQDHRGTIYAGRNADGQTFFAFTLPLLRENEQHGLPMAVLESGGTM